MSERKMFGENGKVLVFTISELVEELQTIQKEYGDLHVWIQAETELNGHNVEFNNPVAWKPHVFKQGKINYLWSVSEREDNIVVIQGHG